MPPVASGAVVAHGSAQYLDMTLFLVDGVNAPLLPVEPFRVRELCRDRDVGIPADTAPLTAAPGLVV